MKPALALLVALLAIGCASTGGGGGSATIADPADREAQAAAAATDWLRMMDSRNYAGAWRAAAPLFQEQVPREQWVHLANEGRRQVGSLQQRALQSVTFTPSMPNGPPGDYAVVLFDSAFEQMPRALERVVLARSGGRWRTVGSFVLPR